MSSQTPKVSQLNEVEKRSIAMLNEEYVESNATPRVDDFAPRTPQYGVPFCMPSTSDYYPDIMHNLNE